jgi:hypothetical protein
MADNEKSEKEQHQDVEELTTWRKKIEMIGIDIKGLYRADRISISTNFQTAVKPRDLRSNDKWVLTLKEPMRTHIHKDISSQREGKKHL